MSFISWLITGIGAGLLAQFVLRDRWSGGIAGNIIMGAIGAVIAGWIVSMFGHGSGTAINPLSLIIAFLGAAALLYTGRVFTSTPVLH